MWKAATGVRFGSTTCASCCVLLQSAPCRLCVAATHPRVLVCKLDRLRAWLTAAQYQPIMPPWHCLPLHAQARGWRAVLAFRTPMSRSTQGASWRSGGPIGGSGGSGGGVVASVLALNTGVFLMWATYGQTVKGRRVMNNHFMVSKGNLEAGRFHTLITSSFSQEGVLHFLVNAVVIWNLGKNLVLMLGPRHFLQVYLLGGVSAGLAHVTYTAFGGSQDVWGYSRRDVPVQGASGATMAMATTTVLMSPRLPFVIFPLPVPIPGWLLLSGLLSYEAYCLAFPQGSDTIAHSAHLGGAAMGAIYFFLFRGRM